MAVCAADRGAQVAHVLPDGAVAGIGEVPVPLGDPGEARRAAIALGIADHAPQRGVAAVARADQAYPVRIDEALRRGPVDRVVEVVLHAPADLALAKLDECLAEAARAAVVGLQHGVAAV